jgi:hypothetical protein
MFVRKKTIQSDSQSQSDPTILYSVVLIYDHFGSIFLTTENSWLQELEEVCFFFVTLISKCPRIQLSHFGSQF